MYSKKQRSISFIVCVFFLFITFASLFYIAKEVNHNCTGEDCPICANIHQAEQNLKNIGSGLTAGNLITTIPVFVVELACIQVALVFCKSLVNQKVRLNN